MTRRLALLRMLGLMPMARYGSQGQMHRRPDQQTDAPPSAVAPTQAAGILRARSVILFGTGNAVGLFEYSGTPALGNNPVAYAVPPGVTKDPFGNTLPVSSGFVTVDSGVGLLARLIGASLQFRSTTSAPNQVPAISGLNASSTGTGLAITSGKGTAGATTIFMQMFDSLQDTAQGGTGVPQIVVNSGPAANPLTSAMVEVQGAIQTTSLNSIIANGNLQTQLGDCTISAGKLNIAAATTPGQPGTGFSLHDDANSFPRVKVALAGDTNDYFTVYISRAGSALPQTISSTTPADITGCSHPVGIGQYAFHARVVFQGGSAAGTANFRMSAPSNTSPSINAMFNMSSGTAGAAVQLAALGPVNSPTLTTGNNIADIWGEVTFTAAGTLTLQCAEGTNLDTVIIETARLWLYPIL